MFICYNFITIFVSILEYEANFCSLCGFDSEKKNDRTPPNAPKADLMNYIFSFKLNYLFINSEIGKNSCEFDSI